MADDGRGRYKIFLGMAAGVGKTYRMLQEGQAARTAGRDVVVGYLEPHDRPETAAQAQGLEQLPRRRLAYRGTEVEEMDLPAIFLRAPDLCLVDELAHTNAPGAEHRKRYEDIEDVLDAGIDVFSTVNVQHLESLNDRVAELTGVRVRETFPDRVLKDADEVVLVDLTPEALIQRLREGRVYPPERVAASLAGFFRVESLAALREVALREVAEEVESKRVAPRSVGREQLGTRGDREPGAAPDPVAERVLALVTPSPSSQRLVRRAWRSAQRLNATLDLLYVTRPGVSPQGQERERLETLSRLASLLGARLHVEEGEDLVAVAARVAAERRITYVIMGQPRERRGLGRLRESLPDRLIRGLPGIDLRVVADHPGQPGHAAGR
jgi:two-component system, OmpR family, sensor histidine kinase KdpD